jgi:hypothetical protein
VPVTSVDRDRGQKRKRTVAYVAHAVVAIAICLVCASYVSRQLHEMQIHRAFGELSPFKIRAGSIGDWPLGTERLISFDAGSSLGDCDASRLLELGEAMRHSDYVRLQLENTRISDQSLSVLKRLRGINVLDVSGSLVTPQGARELQESLRSTKVVRVDAPPHTGDR